MKKKILPIIMITLIYLVFIKSEFVYGQYRHYRVYLRRYFLTGDVQLIYNRSWGDVDKNYDFTHRYHLSLSSFILDPRLISYKLSGAFAQTIYRYAKKNNNYELGLRIRLLSRRPRRTWLSKIPQPIGLSFYRSHSRNYTYDEYNLNMVYSRPEKLRFFYKGRVVTLSGRRRWSIWRRKKNEKPPLFQIHFPRFYMDYTYRKYTSVSTSNNQNVSLRAETSGDNFYLRTSYSYYQQNSKGETYSEQRFSIDNSITPVRKMYTSLDIDNGLEYAETEDQQFYSVNNKITYHRRLGEKHKDYLRLQINSFYNDTTKISPSYGSYFIGDYSVNITPSLNDLVNVNLKYNRDSNGTNFAKLISNRISYRATKTISLSHQLSLSHDKNGIGVSNGISTFFNIKYPVSLNYNYSHRKSKDGSTVSHNGNITISGFLSRVRFYTVLSAGITNNKGDNPFKLKNMSFMLNLNTSILNNYVSLSFNHKIIRTDNYTLSNTLVQKITTLDGYLTRYLMKGMILTVRGNYFMDNLQNKRLFIQPYLTFYIRKMIINAQYTFTESWQTGTKQMNHKIYVRLTRRFYRFF